MSTDTWAAALFEKPLDAAAVDRWEQFIDDVLAPAPEFSKLRAFTDECGELLGVTVRIG